MSEVQTLHFYTTGEAYTGMLVDFFRSGEFKLFEELLGDGNLTKEQKRLAFELRMNLTGDTRTEEGLSYHFTERAEDFVETLYYAIKTGMKGIWNDEFTDLRQISEMTGKGEPGLAKKLDKFKPIFKYFTIEELNEICCSFALREHGYCFSEFPESEWSLNGVILKDGRFIECGSQDHVNLYPVLFNLGLSDSANWSRSKETLHITSGQLNGSVAFSFEHDSMRSGGHKITPEQVATCWRLREHIKEIYGTLGDNTSMQNCTRSWTVRNEKMGGKYGNLVFLNKYFPEVKTPKISRTPHQFYQDGKVFVRTSPVKSLPGLLNSKLVETKDANGVLIDSSNIIHVVNEMKAEFEKFKGVRGDNELHVFYQEFLEGSNGVCHIRREPNRSNEEFVFSYMVSSNQGDIVNGKKSEETLSKPHEIELQTLTYRIFKELQCDGLQFEFVIHNDSVYIVQMRELENEFEKALGGGAPQGALIKGKSFSAGGVEIDVNDILIIESDGKPELLLGKKALIVTGDVEFSHLLALSKALRIPSMYATGPVDQLVGLNKVYFSSRLKEAYINKI